jgi:hypothetical protein
MSYRKYPISPGQIYHVFNRSIAQQPIFLGGKDYQRFLETISFYRSASPPLRLSFYNRLAKQEKVAFMEKLNLSHPTGVNVLSDFVLVHGEPEAVATYRTGDR